MYNTMNLNKWMDCFIRKLPMNDKQINDKQIDDK
jgi:hypothetical protein